MFIKRNWLWVATFLLSLPLIGKEELALGEETIKPLKYPKFSLSADYNLNRKYHGFADSSLRINLENRLSAALSFEAGLYKYFNAGALVGFNIPTGIAKGEPLHYRLDLFAKPYVALGERFSLFSRLGAGISAAQGNLLQYLSQKNDSNQATLQKVFLGTQYEHFAFGGNAFAVAGFEYFPWSRFGLVFEAGMRAEILRNNKSTHQWGREKLAERGVKEAPSSFSYLIYEFPIGLMLHIIL